MVDPYIFNNLTTSFNKSTDLIQKQYLSILMEIINNVLHILIDISVKTDETAQQTHSQEDCQTNHISGKYCTTKPLCLCIQGRKGNALFNNVHILFSYLASSIWLTTTKTIGEETHCNHFMGYSF